MSFHRYFATLWHAILGKSPEVIAVEVNDRLVRPPEERPMMNDHRLDQAIRLFKAEIHDIKRSVGERAWKRVGKPKIGHPFPGVGFACREEGFRVNKRLNVYEHDDCMDFTSLLVTVDKVPALILTERRMVLTVFVCDPSKDYFAEIMSPTTMPCNNVEEFHQMPMSVQKIVHDVFKAVWNQVALRNDPVEKIVSYYRV